MIYNTLNGKNTDVYSEKVEVNKIEPVEWGKNKIIGIKDKYWDKEDPMANLYDKKVKAEAKFITGIFKKDIKLVKEAAETGLINILNGISIVLKNDTGIFDVVQ